jgi:hypothetical protein
LRGVGTSLGVTLREILMAISQPTQRDLQ